MADNLSDVSDILRDSGSDSKDFLSEEDKTKLCVHYQIIVKVIVLMMTIMMFKIWGGTHGSKRTNLIPYPNLFFQSLH